MASTLHRSGSFKRWLTTLVSANVVAKNSRTKAQDACELNPSTLSHHIHGTIPGDDFADAETLHSEIHRSPPRLALQVSLPPIGWD